MRTIGRVVSVAVLAGMLLLPAAAPAGAAVVDSSCNHDDGYCSFVATKGTSGIILLKVRASSDLFGRATACVTKQTTVCRAVNPKRNSKGQFNWVIRWQGNFPRQGTGTYTVTWRASSGSQIGPALHFHLA